MTSEHDEAYLSKKNFTIPSCFQIPLLPTVSDVPNPDTPKATPSQVALDPPTVVRVNVSQSGLDQLENEMPMPNLMEESVEERTGKRRVSAGMKHVRENIDLFVEESTELLSRMKMNHITALPQVALPQTVQDGRECDVGIGIQTVYLHCTTCLVLYVCVCLFEKGDCGVRSGY